MGDLTQDEGASGGETSRGVSQNASAPTPASSGKLIMTIVAEYAASADRALDDAMPDPTLKARLRALLSARNGKEASAEIDQFLSDRTLDAVPIFIELLESSNQTVRDRAALRLRGYGDSRAVPGLVKAIQTRWVEHRTGAFFWALRAHDCSTLLLPMTRWALHGGFEVRSHSLHILTHQHFRSTPGEVAAAHALIREFEQHIALDDDDADVIRIVSTAVMSVEKDLPPQ